MDLLLQLGFLTSCIRPPKESKIASELGATSDLRTCVSGHVAKENQHTAPEPKQSAGAMKNQQRFLSLLLLLLLRLQQVHRSALSPESSSLVAQPCLHPLCADGQPLIMHPFNMKCLLQHYGGYEKLPSRLQVKILEMEAQIQTEALRKRYRYVSHLPLTTNFWFCEVDLRGILPGSAFTLFIDELRYRETRRHRRQKQEQVERLREERMSTVHSRDSPPADFIPFIQDSREERLPLSSGSDESGLDPVLPTPGPADQRKLFSQVTRLGFASAHGAPDLTSANTVEPSVLPHERASNSAGASAGKPSTMSFADIIQAQPLKTVPTATSGSDGPSQSSSKRNRKASKVLLSTAGGRRY